MGRGTGPEGGKEASRLPPVEDTDPETQWPDSLEAPENKGRGRKDSREVKKSEEGQERNRGEGKTNKGWKWKE